MPPDRNGRNASVATAHAQPDVDSNRTRRSLSSHATTSMSTGRSATQFQGGFSCDLCYRRKVKCDRGNPCGYCTQRKMECVPSVVETSDRPRKRRFPEAELLLRIKRYEAALHAYGADVDAIRDGTATPGASDGTSAEPVPGEAHNLSLTEPPSESGEYAETDPEQEFDQIQGLLEIDESGRRRPQALLRHLDGIFTNDSSHLFFGKKCEACQAPKPVFGDLHHPDPFVMLKLWQIYLDNVHPIVKLVHAPAVQRKMADLGSNMGDAPASHQALFFAIYSCAINSLRPSECQELLGYDRDSLLERCQQAAVLWLSKAELWRTSDLTVLQALIIHLTNISASTDPRSYLCFVGMAVRLSQRLRIHRPISIKPPQARLTTTFKVQPETIVEVELSKRLWYELSSLDLRASEKSSFPLAQGMGTGELWGQAYLDLPAPLSDADLAAASNLPTANSVATPSSEMLFCMIRAEWVRLRADVRERQGPRSGYTEFSSARIPFMTKLKIIADWTEKVQDRWLRHCNEAIPQHAFATLWTGHIVCRMKMTSYLCEEMALERKFIETRDPNTKDQVARVREELTAICCDGLDQANTLRNAKRFEGFSWWTLSHMPFVLLVHLIRLLRVILVGPLADRGWICVSENSSAFKRIVPATSTFIRARRWGQLFDPLILGAWKARRAVLGMQPHEPDPEFIKEICRRSDIIMYDRSAQYTRAATDSTQLADITDAPGEFPSGQTPNVGMSSSQEPDQDQVDWLVSLLGDADHDFDWQSWLNQPAGNSFDMTKLQPTL
ncbi:hypothetical protein CBOM_00445 [Ceraceosorus bombacis]|uniref:Zn(2)-C6 fungal-type domain-containing protein n=1 Tax=Ceraceosorus bombacis TaxID=401625 RepID=A0A0N7L908_9BASI|nr:hypothetical protein CBOM_00445 [Ceraceosorus bombacis]